MPQSFTVIATENVQLSFGLSVSEVSNQLNTVVL